MNAEDLAARGFPDTNWADYNLDDLDTCLSDLRSTRQTHNLHLVYVKPTNLQPINILIIWISGSSDERSQGELSYLLSRYYLMLEVIHTHRSPLASSCIFHTTHQRSNTRRQ